MMGRIIQYLCRRPYWNDDYSNWLEQRLSDTTNDSSEMLLKDYAALVALAFVRTDGEVKFPLISGEGIVIDHESKTWKLVNVKLLVCLLQFTSVVGPGYQKMPKFRWTMTPTVGNHIVAQECYKDWFVYGRLRTTTVQPANEKIEECKLVNFVQYGTDVNEKQNAKTLVMNNHRPFQVNIGCGIITLSYFVHSGFSFSEEFDKMDSLPILNFEECCSPSWNYREPVNDDLAESIIKSSRLQQDEELRHIQGGYADHRVVAVPYLAKNLNEEDAAGSPLCFHNNTAVLSEQYNGRQHISEDDRATILQVHSRLGFERRMIGRLVAAPLNSSAVEDLFFLLFKANISDVDKVSFAVGSRVPQNANVDAHRKFKVLVETIDHEFLGFRDPDQIQRFQYLLLERLHLNMPTPTTVEEAYLRGRMLLGIASKVRIAFTAGQTRAMATIYGIGGRSFSQGSQPHGLHMEERGGPPDFGIIGAVNYSTVLLNPNCSGDSFDATINEQIRSLSKKEQSDAERLGKLAFHNTLFRYLDHIKMMHNNTGLESFQPWDLAAYDGTRKRKQGVKDNTVIERNKIILDFWKKDVVTNGPFSNLLGVMADVASGDLLQSPEVDARTLAYRSEVMTFFGNVFPNCIKTGKWSSWLPKDWRKVAEDCESNEQFKRVTPTNKFRAMNLLQAAWSVFHWAPCAWNFLDGGIEKIKRIIAGHKWGLDFDTGRYDKPNYLFFDPTVSTSRCMQLLESPPDALTTAVGKLGGYSIFFGSYQQVSCYLCADYAVLSS